MTSKKIFQLSMALPLLVPMLVWPLLYFRVAPDKGVFGGILVIVAYSGIIGGIPYSILALALSFWMMNRPVESIRKVLLLSPLLMVAVLSTCFAILALASTRFYSPAETLTRMISETLSLSVFILIFGYFYVGLAFGLARLFGSDVRSYR